ncbi:zinc ABC transporter ATP-binding protein ZnuC [Marinomonas mediterranea]|uniref:ABC transporter related protein n=1 Tax=Marinomonas mediterranea (strain ATCC 700492 / JCM 21426 / NBRC 103028 / MMB-1) TaxID=717774 RepID=F2JWA8_MARM1|nr:zinc ABC transporter ATP-binding protein ZnuC [Marinomonas mediterranea]ADZ89496.1 ABC transporter related protein [Marinomonas mediterranea MMB-1]WCN15745.1 zinc ABC transporter ATP-binding protein ZnuC [Marinomonas mediterranea MMB-1]
MSTCLAELSNIGITFGERKLLSNIDVRLHRGEIVTLIGPNGSGKSTLIRTLLGLQSPTEGKVTRHEDLRIGYMPQKLHIDPTLPLTVKHFLGLVRNVDKKDILPTLKKLGIEHLVNSQVRVLSGGETQRVLLARALLNKPNLLVLDEPVQGVDVNGQIELYKLIVKIRDEINCGVLMISHDLHLVMAQTDTVVCINQHVCCSGTPQHVKGHPAYQALFGIPGAESLAIYAHHHDHEHDEHGDIKAKTKDQNAHQHTQNCSH